MRDSEFVNKLTEATNSGQLKWTAKKSSIDSPRTDYKATSLEKDSISISPSYGIILVNDGTSKEVTLDYSTKVSREIFWALESAIAKSLLAEVKI